MRDPGEKRISTESLIWRYGFLALAVIPSAAALAMPMLVAPIGEGGIFPWCLMAGLWSSSVVWSYFMDHRPLKDVYLCKRGIRIIDRRGEVFVPFGSIKSVRERHSCDPRIVVVRLRHETIVGRRFTWIPSDNRDIDSPGAESLVVAELRQLMAAAPIVRDSKPKGRCMRSVMTDDELDGPF